MSAIYVRGIVHHVCGVGLAFGLYKEPIAMPPRRATRNNPEMSDEHK
ncbi:hypothetical protein LINGRAHAP2_LOCUS14229, partial [Linum grandiflorum]